MPPGITALLLSSLSAWLQLVAATCECGYSVAAPKNGDLPLLFTHMLESDFVKTANMSQTTDWARQEFNVTAKDGRGQFGKTFMPSNIMAHPEDAATRDGPAADSENGNDGDNVGVELRVSSEVEAGAVPGAEMDTTRMDLHWGTYRAGMKLTEVKGTCAAFFWYFNDTQEIDMEFLSREFDRDHDVYPANLVIQSKESARAGYDAMATGTFKRVNLTFDPTDGFHEYRFDYLPGRVRFYADSDMLVEMTGNTVPSSPGHLILQHWSNGNEQWSGGPPARDALLTVSYVKAYFNSSDDALRSDWERRCGETKGPACVISDVTAANASTGGQFFGDEDASQNKTDGGTDDDDESGACSSYRQPVVKYMALTSLAVAMIWMMKA